MVDQHVHDVHAFNALRTYSGALMPRGHGRRRRKEVDETSVEARFVHRFGFKGDRTLRENTAATVPVMFSGLN